MRVAGIDVGVSGGLACVDGNEAVYCKMPTQDGYLKSRKSKMVWWKGVAEFLRMTNPDFVYIEQVGAFRGQGVSSMFSFGGAFHGCIAVCEAVGIEYRLVTPKRWQGSLFPKYEGKDTSIAYVENKYRDVDLVLPRCRKPHDGIADAICIADYGLIMETK